MRVPIAVAGCVCSRRRPLSPSRFFSSSLCTQLPSKVGLTELTEGKAATATIARIDQTDRYANDRRYWTEKRERSRGTNGRRALYAVESVPYPSAALAIDWLTDCPCPHHLCISKQFAFWFGRQSDCSYTPSTTVHSTGWWQHCWGWGWCDLSDSHKLWNKRADADAAAGALRGHMAIMTDAERVAAKEYWELLILLESAISAAAVEVAPSAAMATPTVCVLNWSEMEE